jgi:hypothetical protein
MGRDRSGVGGGAYRHATCGRRLLQLQSVPVVLNLRSDSSAQTRTTQTRTAHRCRISPPGANCHRRNGYAEPAAVHRAKHAAQIYTKRTAITHTNRTTIADAKYTAIADAKHTAITDAEGRAISRPRRIVRPASADENCGSTAGHHAPHCNGYAGQLGPGIGYHTLE